MQIFVLGVRGFPNIQGGVEKHCEELYPRLVKFGCKVFVFARKNYFSLQKRFKKWKGVKFIYLWCPQIKGLETFFHTFFGALICIIKRPDIAHFHNIGPALFIPLVKLFKIKTVFTYHSINYKHQKWGKIAKVVLKLGEWVGVRFADEVIVVSKTNKKFLEGKYPRKDLRLIFNGINLPKFVESGETLKKYGLQSKKYILAICRFAPEKGVYDLIKAYRKIQNPEFKLVIAGDSKYQTNYAKEVKRLAKETSGVVLTGIVLGKELAELYSNAGLFVLPSYYEGLPIALLEALSFGLPVLVSSIPQNKELSLPEFRYFEVGNIEMLAEKMVELWKRGVSEEEKRIQREMLRENYDWNKIALEVLKVYQKTIKRN
ncbi:MAG TPA: glycosyltransferase [Candidatus Atribacteria bacterium]|nr:glycosyltransferase [Candidatus Atribacteria bacterium]